MSKVILICGKICCGKTYYCRRLTEQSRAVSLSCDELMLALFPPQLGDAHDEISAKCRQYLLEKAAEIALCGADVILDWGFWTSKWRKEAVECLRARGVDFEWHYIDISEERHMQNISLRNAAVESGLSSDYYVDEGLLAKLEQLFEPPSREEIDVWVQETDF